MAKLAARYLEAARIIDGGEFTKIIPDTTVDIVISRTDSSLHSCLTASSSRPAGIKRRCRIHWPDKLVLLS